MEGLNQSKAWMGWKTMAILPSLLSPLEECKEPSQNQYKYHARIFVAIIWSSFLRQFMWDSATKMFEVLYMNSEKKAKTGWLW